MSAANQIVREGGTIIIAAACADGLPNHGLYASLLAEAGSPQGVLDMLARPGFSAQDQWQVQIQALIQQRAEVLFIAMASATPNSGALFLPAAASSRRWPACKKNTALNSAFAPSPMARRRLRMCA